MRIALPPATLAALVGSPIGEIIDAADAPLVDVAKSLARAVEEAYEPSSLRQGTPSGGGDECNTFDANHPNAEGRTADATDLGILGCGNDEACEWDEASSLGGRCFSLSSASAPEPSDGPEARRQRLQKPKAVAFRKRRNRRLPGGARKQAERQRDLQGEDRQIGSGPDKGEDDGDEDPFECPPNCPVEFCDCARGEDGDGATCAPELNSVCEQNLLAECVPDKYLPFYEQTYCPLAKCLAVDKDAYEECSCAYYQDYCSLYYNYVDSIDECAVADCCGSTVSEQKFTCLPGLAPTYTPTLSPTFSFHPSESPTVTNAPSATIEPSSTRLPTTPPSSSTAPTASSEPTPIATDGPSGQPSFSFKPTRSPTESPTPNPTEGPTVSPTSSPSGVPSFPPSGAPTTVPSSSSAPSTSFSPTGRPSMTQAPTSSANPTAMPSASGQPTFPPSLLPTITMPPSASPTTPQPTDNPTTLPTVGPTKPPTAPPTANPTSPFPTESPVTKDLALSRIDDALADEVSEESEGQGQGGSGGDGGAVVAVGGSNQESSGGIVQSSGANLTGGAAGAALLLCGGVGAMWLLA